MAKKNKLATPDWIIEGFDSEEEYNKSKQNAESLSSSSKLGQTKGVKTEKKTEDSGTKSQVSSSKQKRKTFTVRECPECESDDVGVILGGTEGKGSKGWECHKCEWTGTDIEEKEFTEDELMKYLDKKGEKCC